MCDDLLLAIFYRLNALIFMEMSERETGEKLEQFKAHFTKVNGDVIASGDRQHDNFLSALDTRIKLRKYGESCITELYA